MGVIIKKNEFSINQECYTPAWVIEDFINELKQYVPFGKAIWCPFDTKQSEFVKVLSKYYTVYNTHIKYGQDFYTFKPNFEYAAIVSNPPFQKKRLLIERALTFNKPFFLLYGCSIFNTGGMAKLLNTLTYFFIPRCVNFTNGKKFLCCWVAKPFINNG